MIVRPRPKAWQLLFIMRGSIVPHIWRQVLMITVIAGAIVTFERLGILRIPPIGALPFSLMGIALSIFAGFRNSACYDRWWEARKILGQLVIEARNLSRQAQVYVKAADRDAAAGLSTLTIAFASALRHHLRETSGEADLQRWLAPDAVREVVARRNVPNALLDRLGGIVADLLRRGVITDRIVQILEDRIAALSAVLAACERIKATPLPYAYTLLLHRTCYAFCMLLPFGLMDSAGLATPLFAAVVSYTFFGLDILGEELERPFGDDDNALPLDAICRTVEISVLETTGLGPVPEPLGPKDFVLL